MTVEDTLAFMENLTVPSSLKFVHISFIDASWHDICQELCGKPLLQFNKDLLFVGNKRAKSFSDKFFKVENLSSLELSAQDAPGAAHFIVCFINSLLWGISSELQNLQFTLLHYGQNDAFSLKPSLLSLQDFFKISATMFPSLKTLKVSTPKRHYINIGYNEVKNINLPQLSSFEFSGMMLPSDITIQNIFNIAKKPHSSQPNINDVDISLEILLFGSQFLELLKVLKKSPRNSQVKILILLYDYDKVKDEKDLEFFVERAKRLPLIQNVALNFVIDAYAFEEYKKSLSSLSQVFGDVSFTRDYTCSYRIPKEEFDDEEEEKRNYKQKESIEKSSQNEFSEYDLDIVDSKEGENEEENGTEYQVSENNEVQKVDFENDEKEISIGENQFSEEEK